VASTAGESEDGTGGNAHSPSSLAAIEIPAGATTAVIEVIYTALQHIAVFAGIPATPLSATLKVSEIHAGATEQLGPGVLGPLPP
jgi:hypothetical protein